MCLTGAKVQHATFGSGVIVSQENGYVKVCFEAPYGEKLFVYPDSFAGFLSMEDGEKIASVRAALEDKKCRLAEDSAQRGSRLNQMREKLAAEKATVRSSKKRA